MKLICGSLRCFAIAILFITERNFRLVSGALRTYPTNEIASAGDSVVFPCSTDLQYPLHWLHTPVGTDYPNDVYFHGKHVKPYWPRFQVLKNESRGEYNLSISSVQPADAGTYTCIDKAGHGIQMDAELVVLGSAPIGRSNTSLDPLTICGDQTVIILLTCGVNYTGNVPPELNWKQITMNGVVISHADTSVVKHSNGVDCSVQLRADHGDFLFDFMEGSVFVCEASSGKYNWKSGSVKMLYASNTTLKEEYTSPTSINCMANSNGICNYAWIRVDSDESIVSSTGTLDLDHLGHGQYRCTANCNLGGLKCEVHPYVVEYRSDEHFHDDRNHSANLGINWTTVIGIPVPIIIVAAITLAVVIVILRVKRSKANTQNRERLHTDPSSATLLATNRSLGSFEEVEGQALMTLKLRYTILVGDFMPHGIVNYNDKFYVVSSSHNAVMVFKDVAKVDEYCFPNSFKDVATTRLEDFVINEMEGPMSLELSRNPLCFYIPDRTRECIWRVRGLDGNLEADEWMQNVSKPFQLSVMSNGDVLIPVWPATIKVFDSDSRQIRTINLEEHMMEPYHAVGTSTGSIIVSHGAAESNLHRVCLIATDGTIVWSYGNEKGSGEDQLHNPHHMVLDEKDRVYISDQANMRIVVLDKNGRRLACVETCVETKRQITFRSFYVQKNRSLFVGGYGSILCYGTEEGV